MDGQVKPVYDSVSLDTPREKGQEFEDEFLAGLKAQGFMEENATEPSYPHAPPPSTPNSLALLNSTNHHIASTNAIAYATCPV